MAELAKDENPLCHFVRQLDDIDLQWLMECPALVPELMGLTDHLPLCKECGDRIGKILLGDLEETPRKKDLK